MLNTGSTDSNLPANEPRPTFASSTVTPLQSQMSELRYVDTGFAHGLAASLYMGNIMWNNCSALSLFPNLEMQHDWKKS